MGSLLDYGLRVETTDCITFKTLARRNGMALQSVTRLINVYSDEIAALGIRVERERMSSTSRITIPPEKESKLLEILRRPIPSGKRKKKETAAAEEAPASERGWTMHDFFDSIPGMPKIASKGGSNRQGVGLRMAYWKNVKTRFRSGERQESQSRGNVWILPASQYAEARAHIETALREIQDAKTVWSMLQSVKSNQGCRKCVERIRSSDLALSYTAFFLLIDALVRHENAVVPNWWDNDRKELTWSRLQQACGAYPYTIFKQNTLSSPGLPPGIMGKYLPIALDALGIRLE